MFTIAIEENDVLFRNGLEILLKQLFEDEAQGGMEVHELDSLNVTNADIVVKNYIAGMQFVCHPLLRKRKSNSLLIGLYDGEEIPPSTLLPLCISNVVFINRKDSIDKIKDKILKGWEQCNSSPKKVNHISCLSCKYRTLTRQQVVIAAHFYRGHGLQKTAQMLNINSKTVCTHKSAMMSKFNIDTDCDLLLFLNELIKNKYSSDLYKIVFKNYIGF